MDKSAIPEGENIDIESTDLDVPNLPDPWKWRTANKTGLQKVNIYFGYDVNTVGGQLGEIDNFKKDGEEVWCVCIRDIEDHNGTHKDTLPSEECETSDTFDSLSEAINAVPRIINTYFN